MAMPFGIGASWTTVTDTDHMLRAAAIADKSTGTTAPHPNSRCLIARGPKIISEAFLRARGEKSAELQAVEKARGLDRGATAYSNLEPFADDAMRALLEAGVSRIVVGLENPAETLKGKALDGFKSARLNVQVLGTRPEAEIGIWRRPLCARTIALHRCSWDPPVGACDHPVLVTAGVVTWAWVRARVVTWVLKGCRICGVKSNGVVLGRNSAWRVAYDLMVGHMRIGQS